MTKQLSRTDRKALLFILSVADIALWLIAAIQIGVQQ